MGVPTPAEIQRFVDEAANDGRDEADDAVAKAAQDSAIKCKAAHDAIMDRVAALAPNAASGFELKAVAEAFEHALTVFKPKVVWE
jgi:hypothetical protein